MNNSKIINVRLMKKVLVLVLSFLSVTAFAQNITVKGIVKDGTGEPIIGGSVLVKGSSIGTVTDVDGNYTLSNVPADGVLEFSYIGMKKQDVKVSGKTVINVVLQEDTQILDEVVVTALGLKREQKALGYAVTEVKGDDLKAANTSRLTRKSSGCRDPSVRRRYVRSDEDSDSWCFYFERKQSADLCDRRSYSR